MTVDPFAARLARVRQRFVATLAGKINDTYAVLPRLADSAADAASAVEETYRCMHGLVGIGPTVGFPETGRAARGVEDALRGPRQVKRGLTGEEISALKKSLDALCEVAQRELRSCASA